MSNTQTENTHHDVSEERHPSHEVAPVSTSNSSREKLWLTPEVDIYDHPDHYALFVDVPGVHENDVELEFEGETLTLSAAVNRKDPSPMLHREYRIGSFKRRFRLNDTVDLESAEAQLSDGVLSVRLPKARATQRRQIPISS